jgi:hypothetical protein
LIADYCASGVGDGLEISGVDPIHVMAIVGE